MRLKHHLCSTLRVNELQVRRAVHEVTMEGIPPQDPLALLQALPPGTRFSGYHVVEWTSSRPISLLSLQFSGDPSHPINATLLLVS